MSSLILLFLFLSSVALHTATGKPTVAAAHSLETYLEEVKATLTDPAVSPAIHQQTRDDLRNRLEQVTTPADRAQILLVLASDTMLYRQNIRASIPLWSESRQLFNPGSEGWIQSTLGLAIATQNKMPASSTTIQEARQLYQSILQHDNESSIAARALFNIGRIAEVMDYTGDTMHQQEAREAYKAVFTKWPDQHIAHEAAFRYSNTYLQEAYYPLPEFHNNWQWRIERMHASIDFLKKWVTLHPDNSLAPAMWESIGNVFLLMPDFTNWKPHALEAYLHATGDHALLHGGQPVPLKTNMDRIDSGYLYLRIAALAQQTGKNTVAFEYYTRLITEADSYQRGPEAALQLMHNLRFSREQIIERALWQLQAIGYSPQEAQRITNEFEFLEPPAGLPVPAP